MTDLRKALERMAGHDPRDPGLTYDSMELLVQSAAQAAKGALAALAQSRPVSGEPVAWRWRFPGGDWWVMSDGSKPTTLPDGHEVQPLYAAPPAAAVIEECAKVAETFSNARPGDICEVQAGDWQFEIAAAIRALAPKVAA